MYSGTQLFFIYSGLFFGALMFALVTNSVFMRFFRTFGIREGQEGVVRWAGSQKPAFGGIGFFIIFLGAFAVHGALFPKQSDPFQPELLGLLAATGLGFLMGLADDAYNTRPLLKFSTQIACGVLLVLSGTYIHVFAQEWMNYGITLLWVVGMMNSINMLDNMDGITTVTAICILACGLLSLLTGGPLVTINVVLVIGIMASLCGFLFFNWNPSRMYMGDTGSQFLGVFLAFIGIRCFWNSTGMTGAIEPWRQAVSTLIVFALPIIDTTVVTINRIARGGSPFVGGKDHTTHHLSYAGLSDAQVALVFAGLGALSFFFVFAMLNFIPVWLPWHSVVFIAYFFTLFGFLFGLTRRTKAPDTD
ncbi:MAG: undecaprenyl/decaprenyl-phosphate alpha-N-acetylglucosaminyl 1-phosphate transferase [Flavobacteriales bacterium]|nr:undecaprenyl/decaprenyl-phosphate alpha-N-acetylglucosaminyl 1-phosphate transferase [Flavobacteriales bacterium]